MVPLGSLLVILQAENSSEFDFGSYTPFDMDGLSTSPSAAGFFFDSSGGFITTAPPADTLNAPPPFTGTPGGSLETYFYDNAFAISDSLTGSIAIEGTDVNAPYTYPAWQSVIHPAAKPLMTNGALVVLRGNLAPDGAILKRSAATPSLFNTTGRAVVFSSLADMSQHIDDPDLDVRPDDFLVLQNAGPVGGPGMPEAGYIPIPRKLTGVKDMVRISDARMSGTAFGTVVLHVSPEAAVGGPLGLVRSGDRIELSVDQRRLSLLVDERELERRRAEQPSVTPSSGRGYEWLYRSHIQQAHLGADFDFLRHEALQPGDNRS